jgi:glycerophosphoryl diester phosphodiesterase
MCGVNKKIEDITLDEMKSYPLINTKYTIPTLQEVLTLVDGRVPIMAELKPDGRKMNITKRVYDVIKEYKGDIAIKSFNPLYMLWYKKNAPEVLRGMLSSYFHHTHLPIIYRNLIKRLTFFNRIKPDFISYDFHDLPNKYIKNKNVPVLAWTITNKNEEAEALKYAQNIIFQDYIPSNTKNEK